jgi:hypothetical protein
MAIEYRTLEKKEPDVHVIADTGKRHLALCYPVMIRG